MRIQSPFAIIRFPNSTDTSAAAKNLITRSILSSAIYELWGSGPDYATLHASVRHRTQHLWPKYKQTSFRFDIDAYQGKHTPASQTAIIDSFVYTSFAGPISLKNAANTFVVFEDYPLNAPTPRQLHLGRLITPSGRKAIAKYSLKKRQYIATTSMDAELSLVTANLALAAPGKLAYDPFMGTGSFPLACAHFGAAVFGSDMDGRSIRGKNACSVKANFEQYCTTPLYLGGFVADLTNSPLRGAGKEGRWLDAVLCDPPYGVREGLKVLGSTKVALREVVLLADGTAAHLSAGYVPPKRAFSFVRMLGEILEFSAGVLVERGRLCMWMPVAGEGEGRGEVNGGEEYAIPTHPALELVSECSQHFNKWSRRLLTYRRLADDQVNEEELLRYNASRLALREEGSGTMNGTADDLNAFRRKVGRLVLFIGVQTADCTTVLPRLQRSSISVTPRPSKRQHYRIKKLWSQLVGHPP